MEVFVWIVAGTVAVTLGTLIGELLLIWATTLIAKRIQKKQVQRLRDFIEKQGGDADSAESTVLSSLGDWINEVVEAEDEE